VRRAGGDDDPVVGLGLDEPAQRMAHGATRRDPAVDGDAGGGGALLDRLLEVEGEAARARGRRIERHRHRHGHEVRGNQRRVLEPGDPLPSSPRWTRAM
jgi:hypothetical protein